MADDPRDEIVQHLGALRAFATSLTRNASNADDLVQDTIVKAWTHIDSFKVGTNMRAWLFTILRNTFYSDRRKHLREANKQHIVEFGTGEDGPSHDTHLSMIDFKVAFAQLPDEQREALLLVAAAGFSCEEAAQMCNCAPGTIKSRISRARRRLSDLMALEETETKQLGQHILQAVNSDRPAA